MVQVLDAMAQLGGEATYAELLTCVTQHQVRAAVAEGVIVRVRHGHYATQVLADPLDVAARLNGVVSHLSAATLHGWAVRSDPQRPQIIVPRSSGLTRTRRRGARVRWRDLAPSEVRDRVTTPLRTVVDCARDLPLADALAVADSALRAGALNPEELGEASRRLPRSGRARASQVLEHANALAANPFESALRAHSLEAVGPLFVPQVHLQIAGTTVTPDLVCRELGIVLEADSHTFHTQRRQLDRDCWRYDELALADWLILRFTWEKVMSSPSWVKSVISRGVAIRSARTDRTLPDLPPDQRQLGTGTLVGSL